MQPRQLPEGFFGLFQARVGGDSENAPPFFPSGERGVPGEGLFERPDSVPINGSDREDMRGNRGNIIRARLSHDDEPGVLPYCRVRDSKRARCR
jgi:hypothetical protein